MSLLKVASKNVLIVYAHPEPQKSFNAALRNVAQETLKSQGYSVTVSDLYAQDFDPRTTKADFTGDLKDPDYFKYGEEAEHAYKNGTLCSSISQEIEKIKQADLIIVQTSMSWFSVPAILQGWFEKVFINGFAHNFPQVLDQGLMKGKKIILSITTGAPATFFTPSGLNGDINVILWSINYGTFRFCGFDVLSPQVSYVGFTDEEERKEILDSWKTRLCSLDKEKPMQFIPTDMFDPETGFVLNSEYVMRESDNEFAPTVGQHMGKKIKQRTEN